MKVYQDLEFRGHRDQLGQLVQEIERRLTDGWERSYKRESEVAKTTAETMHCFSCTETRVRPASELWLVPKSDGTLYVSNIVPSKRPSLTYDEYNSIVREFHDRFAGPAAAALGVRAQLGNPEPQIEDFLSPHTARLLFAFSRAANRSVLHPLDRKRWNEFLTAAHREEAPLSGSMLQRWLIEDEKWPEDKASDLVVEYEHAQELLEVYESLQA